MSINKFHSFLRSLLYEFWLIYYYVIYSPKLLFYFVLREILYLLLMINYLIELVFRKK
jgi:hypothetical protein